MSKEKTNNYAMFIANDEQRILDHGHIKNIASSIQDHGFRSSKPLQCYRKNGKLIVVDGHHRLEAAKLVGSPVFYEVENKDAQETMADVNRLVKRWNTMDYIRLYANRGIEDYQKILYYVDFGIPAGMAASMMINNSAGSGNANTVIAMGAFKAKDTQHIEKVKSLIERFADANPAAKSRSFIAAISKCIFCEDFDINVFSKRMNENIGMLEKTSNEEQMLIQIESIYNFRSRNPIPLKFKVEAAAKERCATFGKK